MNQKDDYENAKMTIMNHAKIIYLFALIATAAVLSLFMENVLPVAAIAGSPETKYAVDMISIVTGVGGLFVLLYCFRFAPIRRLVESGDEAVVSKICIARICIWFVLMLVNVVLYFSTLEFSTNPKYAIIFLAIAYIFCWPAMPSQTQK